MDTAHLLFPEQIDMPPIISKIDIGHLLFPEQIDMPPIISKMDIRHLLFPEQIAMPPIISKMDIRHLLFEEYEDAMNKLTIYERALIKNVVKKIEDANLADNLAEFGLRTRADQEEAIRRLVEIRRNAETIKRNSRYINICICAGIFTYICAVIIMN